MSKSLLSLSRICAVITVAGSLVACAGTPKHQSFSMTKDSAPKKEINVAKIKEPTPQALPRSRYGNPASYTIMGKRYHVLDSAEGYNRVGVASWYGKKFHGRLTSNREVYDMYSLTAASTHLPLPTYARVTNLENGRSIIVKVNDRGPFIDNRLIDLSYAAAKKLGYADKGLARVRVTAIDHNTMRPLDPAMDEQREIYMQVASFNNRNNAERLGERLTTIINKPVQIEESLHEELPVYRVQIGPFNHHTETAELQRTLENHGFEDFIAIAS